MCPICWYKCCTLLLFHCLWMRWGTIPQRASETVAYKPAARTRQRCSAHRVSWNLLQKTHTAQVQTESCSCFLLNLSLFHPAPNHAQGRTWRPACSPWALPWAKSRIALPFRLAFSCSTLRHPCCCLCCASADGTIRVWDCGRGHASLHWGHGDTVVCCLCEGRKRIPEEHNLARRQPAFLALGASVSCNCFQFQQIFNRFEPVSEHTQAEPQCGVWRTDTFKPRVGARVELSVKQHKNQNVFMLQKLQCSSPIAISQRYYSAL